MAMYNTQTTWAPQPPPPRTSPPSSSSAVSVNTINSIGSGTHQPSRIPGDVPTAVRNLLLSVKQLQESLYQWSTNRATETQVSDIYVQIGTDLNTTIQAFAFHRIDLNDILTIPKDLRTVLEQCLAEDPSPETLDMFMPDVRSVLYRLLQGLQARQEAWRAVGGRGGFVGAGIER